ncbi:cytochrome C [Thiocapsa sp.]|uniref:cytochrome C n=1 Tax=Thiocapsa sp. TaxID=2024551 RepID=UPI002C8DEB53|nr:cytochrome C [Thiocapsa sp.]HSO83442.1 cytochrome C [Thiocapsa sp.]
MPKSTRTIAIIAAGLLSLGAVGLAVGDSDDDDHEKQENGGSWLKSRPDVAPVMNAAYGEECGSCHLAYQPGLLPALDWARIMGPDALANHYGDDASLPDALRGEIASYLVANSADQGTHSRSRAFSFVGDAAADATLPRITQTRYFVNKHDEIPKKWVAGNQEVGSFSQCNSCHRGANEGIYDEEQVSIPGHGRWED